MKIITECDRNKGTDEFIEHVNDKMFLHLILKEHIRQRFKSFI